MCLTISLTRNECTKLENYKKKINDEIKKSNARKEILQNKIDELAKKEKLVLDYLDWFYGLKKEIMDSSYKIDINDIQKLPKYLMNLKAWAIIPVK